MEIETNKLSKVGGLGGDEVTLFFKWHHQLHRKYFDEYSKLERPECNKDSIREIFEYFRTKEYKEYENRLEQLKNKFKNELDNYKVSSSLRKEILNTINSLPESKRGSKIYTWECLTSFYFEPYSYTNPLNL